MVVHIHIFKPLAKWSKIPVLHLASGTPAQQVHVRFDILNGTCRSLPFFAKSGLRIHFISSPFIRVRISNQLRIDIGGFLLRYDDAKGLF